MKFKLDAVITATLVICAVITTALVLRRELMFPATTGMPADRRPVFISEWCGDLGKGIRLGPAVAPVSLIEFADSSVLFAAASTRHSKRCENRIALRSP